MKKYNLKEMFPKLMSKIEEDDLDELRYLVVIDENYEDVDDEELDVFDPEDYNYMVYLTERTMNALGEELAKNIHKELENIEAFENFLASEEDLFGIKSDLDEEALAIEILNFIESKIDA